MPVKEHPVFRDPIGNENLLWRYLDFTKLVSLLQRRELFFCRSDKFNDNFEGAYPKKEVEFRGQSFIDSIINNGREKPTDEQIKHHIEELSTHAKLIKSLELISCWHYNANESEAMWKLYAGKNKGIAILSDSQRLRKSLDKCPVDFYAGKVRYIDYDNDIFYHKDDFPEKAFNFFTPFIHKRKAFEHEKEYRVLNQLPMTNNWVHNWEDEESESGKYYVADLDILIKKIIISPESAKWFFELVQDTVSQYLPSVKVEKSKLDSDPLF